MPSRPPRPCAKPGCGGLTTAGRYCERHRHIAATEDRDRKADLDRSRGTAAQRGYDATWRRLRLTVLAEEPLCRLCRAAGKLTPAAEVDHVVPIAERPDLRLDRENLRPLCKPCHSRVTATQQGFARRRG